MTRSSYIALCAALMLVVASAANTNSLTSAGFTAAPGKVFDGTATTGADKTTWGTYTNAVFGAGSANTTAYAYGWTMGSSTTITAVASRALNTTLLSNGTADTTMASVIGTDASYGTTITILTGPMSATGLGSMALAYTAKDTATVPCDQVYVSIFTGGTAAPTTKAITSYTCSKCTDGTAGTGTGYVNAVTGVFYENATYYVTYTTTKWVETMTSGGSGCSAAAPVAKGTLGAGTVTANIQGVSASGSTLKWTAAPAFYTGTTSTAGNDPSPLASAIKAMCGAGNYTNSTNFQCAYLTGASPNVLTYIPVAVDAGTAGTAVTVATSVAASGSYPQTQTDYTCAGFVHSQYQQGVLINKFDTITASSGGTVTYANSLMFYNLTSGATSTSGATAGGITLNITNSYQSGTYGGDGLPYLTGWGLITWSSSAANTFGADWGTYFANGTLQNKQTSFFSGAAQTASYFVDAYGALWAGAYSTDTTVTTGYLGKIATQIVSSGANALTTILAFVALFLASIFAF